MIEISLLQYWLWLLFGILIGIFIGIIIGIAAHKTTNIEEECLGLMKKNTNLKSEIKAYKRRRRDEKGKE